MCNHIGNLLDLLLENQTLFFKELIKLNIVIISLHVGVDQFSLMILFIIIITRYEYHVGIYLSIVGHDPSILFSSTAHNFRLMK